MSNLYESVKQGITAWCASDELLHEMCIAINTAYDEFDFDHYDELLDMFTDEIGERNWLEDLCTDLRYLGDWDKC